MSTELEIPKIACQKILPWDSKRSSGKCSRMAKVAEIEERTVNGELTTNIYYYCTQHTKDYQNLVRQRRHNRYKTRQNHENWKFNKDYAGQLALKLLRLQGAYGLPQSQSSHFSYHDINEEIKILTAELERQFPDAY